MRIGLAVALGELTDGVLESETATEGSGVAARQHAPPTVVGPDAMSRQFGADLVAAAFGLIDRRAGQNAQPAFPSAEIGADPGTGEIGASLLVVAPGLLSSLDQLPIRAGGITVRGRRVVVHIYLRYDGSAG